ncbi:hypothetical protein EN846_34795, partial [Mesorhizobium sp. M4B.F.Ca.ET.203.01.1.1]|uniref:hypothetical protein n=1 Tax=Mesorhizobium sp. M4B.F.Ca.ET.203.01.1.1 TaxID=2563953 RepID=UPI001093F53E
SAPVDVETDALSLSPAEPAPERDAPTDAGATAVADAAIEAGLEVGELTASDDLSRYFDAEWPSAPGEGELGLPEGEWIQAAEVAQEAAADEVE